MSGFRIGISCLFVLACLLPLHLPASAFQEGETEAAPAAESEIEPSLPSTWTDDLEWRSIGPANMGGRITDIAVSKEDSSTYWVATASGGLLKTTNNGITYEHQFDHENTVSIGDIAVAPSDSKIVWVGTGEANPRNSVSWGDGVYKSTDGGETWKQMGRHGPRGARHRARPPRSPVAPAGAQHWSRTPWTAQGRRHSGSSRPVPWQRQPWERMAPS